MTFWIGPPGTAILVTCLLCLLTRGTPVAAEPVNEHVLRVPRVPDPEPDYLKEAIAHCPYCRQLYVSEMWVEMGECVCRCYQSNPAIPAQFKAMCSSFERRRDPFIVE
ncbi:unnamed protein product [Lymnaea stagnalis]|uniref:Uncharacterized protein n=1 Tax=Lymnaea stagnalis TaxID=6523 RepID=A0AAV2I214_LYMST